MKRGNGDDEPGGQGPGAPTGEAAKEEARGLEPVEGPAGPEAAGEDLDSVRAERDRLKERLLRRSADFENYRKRVERDREQAGNEAAVAVLQSLIPTLDSLDRALEAEGDESALREGVELTRRELLAALEARGLTVEDPQGERFDPARHQALSHEPAPGFDEGFVAEVHRKGYSFRDRLLRPALVKVAKGPAGGAGPEKVH